MAAQVVILAVDHLKECKVLHLAFIFPPEMRVFGYIDNI